LGGPNGAGKTTAARELVPDELGIREFVNADEIARSLSPSDPDKVAVTAGRLMLERMRTLARGGQSFAFETTCSGRTHLGLLSRLKADGWRVSLMYLWLRSPEAAVARVQRRVLQGGHGVSPDVVKRRYRSGLANMLGLYLPSADIGAIYDNSDMARVLVAEKMTSSGLAIRDESAWSAIQKAANDGPDR
jgi:predicted ABC-type ATPase